MQIKALQKNIFIAVLFFLSACAPTIKESWRDGSWSSFKESGRQKSQVICVRSVPSRARIYVNGQFAGYTPENVKLFYPVLVSEKHDELIRKVGKKEKYILKRQKERRKKNGSRIHSITLKKEGYLSVKKDIRVPEYNCREILFNLKTIPKIVFTEFVIEKRKGEASFLEKTYDLLFSEKHRPAKKKMNIYCKEIPSQICSALISLGKFSYRGNPKMVLSGEISWGWKTTRLSAEISDHTGRVYASSIAMHQTPNFDVGLNSTIRTIASDLTKKFLNNYLGD